jgi:predicted transcriptional regulator
MIKLSDVASVMRRAEERGEYNAADWIAKVIVKGLTPAQSKVYQAIRSNAWISTPDLSETTGIRLNHAGRIGKQLHDYGLVTRKHRYLPNDRESRYYIWRVK